jgi:uncharacterized membrane protein YgaE (UPF0421/DUF939 family)
MKPMPLDLQILRDLVAGWWRQFDFRKAATDSFKTALAAVLCLWLAHLVGLQHGYWAAISAIVVMGSDAGVTFTSSRDRIIGTGVGALLGWGTSYAWHDHVLLYGLSVALCVLLCSTLQFHKAGHLAAVALTVIVLMNLDATPGRAALGRFLEVGLGVLVALAVTLLVLPPKPVVADQR